MMKAIETIIFLISCHLIGDYVLQLNFIAESKGKNLYHMFVHCFLYCIPFYVLFGLCWQLPVIFITHIIIDTLKARWGKINYIADQALHYAVMAIYFI